MKYYHGTSSALNIGNRLFPPSETHILREDFRQRDRDGFNKVCQLIFKGEVDTLIIENKDRLVRFGFDMLEKFFKYFETNILVLNDKIENKTYEQELTEDLISVIHYFTMKSYSHRSKLNKLRKELENNEKESKSKHSDMEN